MKGADKAVGKWMYSPKKEPEKELDSFEANCSSWRLAMTRHLGGEADG